MSPTVVLVHGAHAESSSWDDVVVPLAPGGTLAPTLTRAGARRTVEIAGASHVVGTSHVAGTVELVLEAAGAATTTAA